MNDDQPKFSFVMPGPTGEPAVVKALLGDDIQISEKVIPDYEVRRQPKPPGFVWEYLAETWEGKPYPGAFTLVPKPGASARVTSVDFKTPDEVKEAVKAWDFWNGHDRSRDPETNEKAPEWFRYQSIGKDGNTVLVTEMLTQEPDSLEEVPENYRTDPEYLGGLYQDGIKEMALQAAAHRAETEQTNNDPEVGTSHEVKG